MQLKLNCHYKLMLDVLMKPLLTLDGVPLKLNMLTF